MRRKKSSAWLAVVLALVAATPGCITTSKVLESARSSGAKQDSPAALLVVLLPATVAIDAVLDVVLVPLFPLVVLGWVVSGQMPNLMAH